MPGAIDLVPPKEQLAAAYSAATGCLDSVAQAAPPSDAIGVGLATQAIRVLRAGVRPGRRLSLNRALSIEATLAKAEAGLRHLQAEVVRDPGRREELTPLARELADLATLCRCALEPSRKVRAPASTLATRVARRTVVASRRPVRRDARRAPVRRRRRTKARAPSRSSASDEPPSARRRLLAGVGRRLAMSGSVSALAAV